MGKAIVITGTPGTGKTSVAKRVAEILKAPHIDLSKLVIDEQLYVDYDEERASFIIDEEKVIEKLKELLNKNNLVIIDSHYGEIVPREYVDKVIVLRTDPEILEERLKKKGWWWEKIRENIEAEILSICTINAINVFGEEKVYEVDTSSKDIEETVREVVEIIKGTRKDYGLKYDWLSLKSIDRLAKYFKTV